MACFRHGQIHYQKKHRQWHENQRGLASIQEATGKVKRTKANRRHLLANKTSRQRKTGKVLDAYADKSCKKTIKKLLPYGG